MNDATESGQGSPQPPSEARRRANRTNAQRSTGPRTGAGKAASSRNAERHGMYACGGVPIERGPFIEDPDEVQRFIGAIVSALAPSGFIEELWALRVAALMLREGRIDRFEASLLEGTNRMSTSELRVMGDEDLLWFDYDLADRLDTWLDANHGREATAWSKPDALKDAAEQELYYEAYAELFRRCKSPVEVRATSGTTTTRPVQALSGS